LIVVKLTKNKAVKMCIQTWKVRCKVYLPYLHNTITLIYTHFIPFKSKNLPCNESLDWYCEIMGAVCICWI